MCCCNTPKHAISGKIELHNGQVLNWLQFIDAKFSLSEAQDEAVRIVSAHWKGVTTKCWC